MRAFFTKAVFWMLALALLAGCDNGGPENEATPFTVDLSCTVSELSVFGGATPIELEIGQTFTIRVSFFPEYSYVSHGSEPDSIFAAYILANSERNRVWAQIDNSPWEGFVSQILIHNNSENGDRIAFHVLQKDGEMVASASFDFKDTTAPFDLLSSTQVPEGQGDLEFGTAGSGVGVLGIDGNMVRFSVNGLSE